MQKRTKQYQTAEWSYKEHRSSSLPNLVKLNLTLVVFVCGWCCRCFFAAFFLRLFVLFFDMYFFLTLYINAIRSTCRRLSTKKSAHHKCSLSSTHPSKISTTTSTTTQMPISIVKSVKRLIKNDRMACKHSKRLR